MLTAGDVANDANLAVARNPQARTSPARARDGGPSAIHRATPIFMLSTALRALGRHPLRAALTMLGISIGTAAVIAMVSIGQGASKVVAERLESMGSNMLFVEAGNRVLQGVKTANDTMMYEDVLAVRSECPLVALASPNVDFRAQVGFGNQNWNTSVSGVDADYQLIRNWRLAEGDFITDAAIEAFAKVAVLGQTVARQIFPKDVSPIGETIRLRGMPYRVIGVLEAKGMNVTGGDQDDVVVIPWTTAQRKMLGIRHIKDMYISIVSRDAIGPAKEQITALLRQRHHLVPEQPDDHSIRDYTEIADKVNETNQLMTVLLSAVASLALLIGGINTMSIMLVTVTERTHEIGIRLAVGARGADVRFQFLFEAGLLTLMGGLAGVGIGISTSVVISRVLEWPTMISTAAIATGVVVSTAIGVVFGYYPAAKASALDPIEALRHEA